MSQKVKFINTNRSTFFATTRKRAEAYLQEKENSRNANRSMWAKAVFFVIGFFSLYLLLLSGWFGTWAMLGMTGRLAHSRHLSASTFATIPSMALSPGRVEQTKASAIYSTS